MAVCCASDCAQLVEQAGVLDSDNGLASEILNQLDLLVGEWPHLLAVDGDHAHQLAFFEHWYDQQRPGTGDLGDRLIGIFGDDVGKVDDLFRVGNAVKDACPAAWRNRIALLFGGPCRRSIMQRNVTEYFPVVQQQVAEARLADVHCVFQHRLKYRLQCPGRPADDLENL